MRLLLLLAFLSFSLSTKAPWTEQDNIQLLLNSSFSVDSNDSTTIDFDDLEALPAFDREPILRTPFHTPLQSAYPEYSSRPQRHYGIRAPPYRV